MTRGFERVVVDTYAWIELFTNGPRAGLVKKVLLEAEELYTPDIVLAELARKYAREGVDAARVKQRLAVIERLSTILCIDPELAARIGDAHSKLLEHARKRGLKSKPSLADAVILAAAWVLRAKVLTGDQHFEGLPETIWLG